MRVTKEQSEIIKGLTHDLLGDDAHVLLFGSRVDDTKRGGDIDLLVEVSRRLDSAVLTGARLAARIERALGGRKVDVLLVDAATSLQPVHRHARAHGVAL